MIRYRKISFFDKYLDSINEKNKFLQQHDYYIKIPARYDVRYWLMAALKNKLFDVSPPKPYFTLENKEATADEIKKIKMEKGPGSGGILIFPNDASVILRYLHHPVKIFKDKSVKKIFKKYSNNILWCLSNRYRGIYKNTLRNTVFNSDSDTLEILGLNSGDLINVAVKIAVQLKQTILLIKDMNNEQMIILGKKLKEEPQTETEEIQGELTNYDVKKLKLQYNDVYKLAKADRYTLWEMTDIYPKINEFWIEEGRWFGK